MTDNPSESEASKEQLRRIQHAKTLRMNAFKRTAAMLTDKAKPLDTWSKLLRLVIILLGAVVAFRSVIDQLMINYSANEAMNLLIQVGFLIVGISISVAAGLQSAFKFEEKAAKLRELANRSYGLTAEYMTKFDRPGTIESMWSIIDEQNAQLKKILDDASGLGVDSRNIGISFDSTGEPILEK